MINISQRLKPAQVDRPETLRKKGPLFRALPAAMHDPRGILPASGRLARML